MEEIARRARDSRNLKVAEEHEVPLRIAAGNGNDRASATLTTVVKSEPAGEKSVAVTDLQNVALVESERGQASRNAFCPDVEVFARVRYDDRLTRRPRTRVITHDFIH